ncbi:4-hydroxyphenylacetate 3-hydroxylase N-terminal domain-containing protein (plasmid) [Sinorhizobium medicae]|uniref:4-hydroxyphenylacetate 3-hydroxylase family protein n=1 Tax=Sinorhizobium medicae TaxID=110321 RepID=UPI002AF6BC0A|nr:4-hydroxyphenylacetate 3-hydroxylase N-terminal domain-containing protein [Sinorhizobium medicae]WQO76014.1 4-hydroxyphenylacetate 3-hydroxylase N-terminal domain-containing protein [Sinorhizobium medicae]
MVGTMELKGALNGARYMASLSDDREVWLDGERVNVSTDPAFEGMRNELARLYDQQHQNGTEEIMTFVSPESGKRVSCSYLLPRTPDDLVKRRRNTEHWSRETWGQMARIPDFMASVVVGFYDFRDRLASVDPQFGQNVIDYYAYCRDADLAVTHSIVDPQIDRSSTPLVDADLALQVVKETSAGIVVRGAKQLATLAPFAHELLVYLSASYAQRGKRELVSWFAIPLATPGLKVLCREPFSLHRSGHGHPFARRFDEQDALVIFDDVLVPWNRVFLLYDGDVASRGLASINAWSLYASQVRFHQKLLTFVAAATLMAKSIGVDEFRNIRENLGELVMYAEIVRLGLRGMEADARRTDGGLWAPGSDLALSCFAAQIAPRLQEILRRIGASGLIMQPSEADLRQSALRPFLDRYMRGKAVNVVEKSRLFRLAWDLVGDGSAVRQDLYERWHRGDVARNRTNLFLTFDQTSTVERMLDVIRTDPDA